MTQTLSHETPDRLLGRDEVLALCGIGKSKLYDMINHGEFEAPMKLGSRSVWPAREVRNWQDRQRRGLSTPPKKPRRRKGVNSSG